MMADKGLNDDGTLTIEQVREHARDISRTAYLIAYMIEGGERDPNFILWAESFIRDALPLWILVTREIDRLRGDNFLDQFLVPMPDPRGENVTRLVPLAEAVEKPQPDPPAA